MPSLFSRKKSTNSIPQRPAPQKSDSSSAKSPVSEERSASSPPAPSSPEKRNRGSILRDREREKQPKSPRASKSRSGASTRRRSEAENEHPLNWHPDDPRRLSALSAMSSPTQENGGGVGTPSADPMETTPAPETPGAFPQTNGDTNGTHDSSEESGPAPPPHRTPASPPLQNEKPAVDAEACKAAGNKFYKERQYEKAIAEYSKGRSQGSHCRPFGADLIHSH